MKHFLGLIIALLCVPMLCLTVNGAESTVITEINFDNTTAVAEENLSVSGYGDKESGYACSTTGGRVYASVSGTDLRKLEWSKGTYGDDGMQAVMTGGTKNPWGTGAYLEVRVSTKGYEALTFSASIGATNKGPRDFKLQYSTDGRTFHNIAGTEFTVSVNKTLYPAFDRVALPAETANCDMVYIRIAVASNIFVNGTAGLVGSTGGEVAINHILLEGKPIATTTTTASSTTDTTASESTTSTATSSTFSATTTTPVTTTTVAVTTTATQTAAVATGEHSASGWMMLVLLFGAAAGILGGCLKRVS